MVIITDNLNELYVVQQAIDYLKESLVKSKEDEPIAYITKADPPMKILDQDEYDTLQNIELEWHSSGWISQ